MYFLIIYLPLINAIVAGLGGRFLGVKGVQFFTVFNMFLTLLTALFIFFEVALSGAVCYLKLFNWFSVGLFYVDWGFLFDSLTATMLIVITSISFLVHMYAIEYMRGDPFVARFMAYLSLFTWFMIILVTADNLVQLFVGWEGVGLVSYLLINFWFTIPEANKSALKAMVVNRVGDLGLAIAIAITYKLFKSIKFTVFLPLVPFFSKEVIIFFGYSFSTIEIIAILIFVGAVGKSAQLGLHIWLPDAMAGPTPVSALIHAATMVTAGVFILLRIAPLLEYAKCVLIIITVIGAATAFFSATIGFFQYDLKKIIAYSTCSQLGYMIFICGLSNYSLSIFHLTNHAFFKALLFLSAGAIIHAMSNEQDIRRMGGLIQILPYTYVMILIGSLALMGTPFLSGFYSKDFILEVSYASYHMHGGFVYWLGAIAAFFTAFYSFRLIYFVFYTKTNAHYINIKNVHEVSFLLGFPLSVLALNSIFFGYVFKDFFIGLGTDAWINTFPVKKNIIFLESEFLSIWIKNIPFLFSMLGVFSVFFINIYYPKEIIIFFKNKVFLAYEILNLLSFLSHKWKVDVFYNKYIVNFFFDTSYYSLKEVDRGLIELIGPLGLVRGVEQFRLTIKKLQTSYVYHYLFISLVFLIGFFFFFSSFFMLVDVELYFFFITLILFVKIQRKI